MKWEDKRNLMSCDKWNKLSALEWLNESQPQEKKKQICYQIRYERVNGERLKDNYQSPEGIRFFCNNLLPIFPCTLKEQKLKIRHTTFWIQIAPRKDNIQKNKEYPHTQTKSLTSSFAETQKINVYVLSL